MMRLLAAAVLHHHYQCYRPPLMEQQQSRHPLLQIKQPDINITSVDKKTSVIGALCKIILAWYEKTTQI
jgi:hypothetical protein